MRKSLLALVLSMIVAPVFSAESWPQWGGSERDFAVKARKLSTDWGENGPDTLWSRPLGGGFASIVSDGKRLVTMYRAGEEEVIVALNPKDGKTLWEHRYTAPIPETQSLSIQYGKGPNGTPLLVDGKVVTLGFMGHVHCVDADTGKSLWSHDLARDHEVGTPYFGHATSPVATSEHAVIVAGGVFAFDLDSGKIAWSNRDHQGSYGSPILWGKGPKRQIVTPVTGNVLGIDPQTGKTLWTVEHKNQWGTILTTPIVDKQGRIFLGTAQVGGILVDPAATDDAGRTVWVDKKAQVNHSNAVRSGGTIYASVGESASFVSATDLKTGEQLWKKRGFGQANLLRVGDRYILLDFDGELAIVELNRKGMEVAAQATINEAPTWTPPTLLGTTLYVRDESRIMALDLSAK